MKQNSSSEADSFPASKDIPHILWKSMFHFSYHNSLPILSYNQLVTISSYEIITHNVLTTDELREVLFPTNNAHTFYIV
jgi:hypothetical protein